MVGDGGAGGLLLPDVNIPRTKKGSNATTARVRIESIPDFLSLSGGTLSDCQKGPEARRLKRGPPAYRRHDKPGGLTGQAQMLKPLQVLAERRSTGYGVGFVEPAVMAAGRGALGPAGLDAAPMGTKRPSGTEDRTAWRW